MNADQFLDRKEILISGKKFLVSRIPTLAANDLYVRIVKAVGDYGKFGMTMLPLDIVTELFRYCAAWMECGGWTVLDTNDTINSYLPNLFDCIQLQFAMCKENFGFFMDGKLSRFLNPKEESGQPS